MLIEGDILQGEFNNIKYKAWDITSNLKNR